MPYRDRADQRAASRRHYEANRSTMKRRAADHRKRQRSRLQAYVRSAKSKPCADCGESYPYYVMQFDHINGEKLANVADMATGGASFTRLRNEISKCDVVCANCHAERTHQRGQHFTAAPRERHPTLF